MILIDKAEKALGVEVAKWLALWNVSYEWADVAVRTEEGGYEKVGDYTTDKWTFLVEAKYQQFDPTKRKFEDDFWTSLNDNRLDLQAEKESRVSPDPYIAYVGYLSELIRITSERNNRDETSRVISNVARMRQQYGVTVMMFETPQHFAKWLQYMEKYAGTVPRAVVERKKIEVPTAQKMLMQVDGVGEELSARLLTRFGNLNTVLSATEKALTEVEGIGKKKAAAIREIGGRMYEARSDRN